MQNFYSCIKLSYKDEKGYLVCAVKFGIVFKFYSYSQSISNHPQ